jgi:signal transduction histidine kinase
VTPAMTAAIDFTAEGRGELHALQHAFEVFTDATARLEREYGALQTRLAALTGELEEKNRLLAESMAREQQLEAEALRRNRLAAMGEMAAMLAHEIRNPLGAMELFTGLLLQDLLAQPSALRLAQQVAGGITDLNHLVTNLLEFTRTRRPAATVVDCCALVDDMLRYTVDVAGGGAGIVIERSFAAPAVTAIADVHLVRPVVLNLLRNAVQAMPEGGILRVAIASDGAETRIAVSDTGHGIAPADHEAIFKPFFTTRQKGTGLGLAVVRDLVVAMRGRLEVDSALGSGSTFTVTLPAV